MMKYTHESKPEVLSPKSKYEVPNPKILEGCHYNAKIKLDLAFNNVKPKDWYFVLD